MDAISCIFQIVYGNCYITNLCIFRRFSCKMGNLWNQWLGVMMVGRICYCMVVVKRVCERFLVRMLKSFSRGSW